MNETRDSRSVSGNMVGLLFAAIFLLWLITPMALMLIYPSIEARGQFGDQFGSINALFSGFAFAGVVVAIFLQREELKLQRIEIASSRKELARTATAQEESRSALQSTVYAQVYKTAVDLLQEANVVSARKYVFLNLRDKPLSEWDDGDVENAEIVCRTYDMVGIMVANQMIPASIIADSWGDSLRRSWSTLSPLVLRYREKRDAPEFWDDFESLATHAFDLAKSRKRSE